MKYDFFLIFSTIILSLSVTQIFEGIGNFVKNKIRYGKALKGSLTLTIWILVVLLVSFQYFLGMYSINEMIMYYWLMYLTNLLFPAIVYIGSRVLIPNFNSIDVLKSIQEKRDVLDKLKTDPDCAETIKLNKMTKGYDLDDYFNKHVKSIVIFGIFIVAISALNKFAQHENSLIQPFTLGEEFKDQLNLNLFYIVFILILALVGIVKSLNNNLIHKEYENKSANKYLKFLITRFKKNYFHVQTALSLLALGVIIFLINDRIPNHIEKTGSHKVFKDSFEIDNKIYWLEIYGDRVKKTNLQKQTEIEQSLIFDSIELKSKFGSDNKIMKKPKEANENNNVHEDNHRLAR